MCSKCSSEMIDCFSDETCRKALDCLNKCKGTVSHPLSGVIDINIHRPSITANLSIYLSIIWLVGWLAGNDQVCSYRCISSYETQAFEKFAKCIIQVRRSVN